MLILVVRGARVQRHAARDGRSSWCIPPRRGSVPGRGRPPEHGPRGAAERDARGMASSGCGPRCPRDAEERVLLGSSRSSSSRAAATTLSAAPRHDLQAGGWLFFGPTAVAAALASRSSASSRVPARGSASSRWSCWPSARDRLRSMVPGRARGRCSAWRRCGNIGGDAGRVDGGEVSAAPPRGEPRAAARSHPAQSEGVPREESYNSLLRVWPVIDGCTKTLLVCL